ncbi:unnamed protein product [Caenorhabditis bovis]|uniref:cyclin-dependent kinase n=1 Tax=Caenorhabditis bovis TaxID=2654633 RepID=A0A8S1EZ78_9PELO|nr:unnamed protein product [Caenorhabditis bovis]
MSDKRGSSPDDGELSDDSHSRSHSRRSDSEEGGKSSKEVESKLRANLLNRISHKKRDASDGDDDDERFTIQPKDAQKAREEARNREKERDRERDSRKNIEDRLKRVDRHPRDLDIKQRDRENKARHERSGKSRHDDRDRHKKHENSSSDEFKEKRRERDRSHERSRHRNRDDRKDERHRRKGNSSDDDHSAEREPPKKQYQIPKEPLKLSKPKTIETVEIVDVEMSPIELREPEEEKPITSFTLEADVGPKKYSKFESDPESDDAINEQSPHSSRHPSGGGDSDIEEIADDESKMDKSVDDATDEDDERNYDGVKWQDLTEEQREMLDAETRKRLEDAYQKELISRLPVFYPGIMGCRSIAEFECVNRVEEGTYGVVYRGRDKRTDEIVALKRLKMEKEKEGFPITALREINMLLKAGNHPNIVNVKEILIGTNMDKIYMAMEFVEHDLKSLIDTMVRRNKRFSTGEQKTLLRQLLSGIEHMHNLWILHRDLKTSNLLLSHTGILKIADFGLAREYGDPLKKFTPVVVTLWYRSPELLLGSKYYSTPVDMWSIGCIMAEFILLKPLFQGRGEIEQLKKIFLELGTPSEKIWPGVKELDGWKSLTFENYPYNQLRKKFLAGRLLNDTGFKLLMRFLTYDPNERITATDALDHDWFRENPLPVPPEEFPTFPAKSEQHKAPPPAMKKSTAQSNLELVDPETAKLLKQFEVKPEHIKTSGFSLKFGPARF